MKRLYELDGMDSWQLCVLFWVLSGQPVHFWRINDLLGSLLSVVQWLMMVLFLLIFCFFPIMMLLFISVAFHFLLLLDLAGVELVVLYWIC